MFKQAMSMEIGKRDSGASRRIDDNSEALHAVEVDDDDLDVDEPNGEPNGQSNGHHAEADRVKRGVGRPSKAQPFRAFVVDLLLKQPHLRSLEIVRKAKLAGYDGGKSALYSLIASVRPRRSR